MRDERAGHTRQVGQPFSALIRTASQEVHTEAERSSFMHALMGGRLGIEAYTALTGQLWFVYQAMEAVTPRLVTDPVAGPFIRPELFRSQALERDLAHLEGEGWRERLHALPATRRYAERIAEVAENWPGGYLAHHYTRYLGDLSGGQVIRGLAERNWGLAPKGDGVRFYVFPDIHNPAAFKREYRALLDAVPVDEVGRRRIVEECRLAFRLNIAMFEDLARRFPLSA
ncbi:biliverdin-producing heme oxygenase [Allostreptomyces psammosilenae]|uniref:biliverdin-producing heme oxygenase n=1 Tax=Allostreptomyces psammosilenae TaxID=1892865 RepID=UPI0015C6EFE9|nr:biliverdin-producing heme oxygenase [Allostreptomyces psammosilenae]